MARNAFGFEDDGLEQKQRAHVLEFIECALAELRPIGLCPLLERGSKTRDSARCFHDVVEIVIEKLPRHEAAAHRLVFWALVRILCVAFEEHLAAQLPSEVMADAQAQAAIMGHRWEATKYNPEEN